MPRNTKGRFLKTHVGHELMQSNRWGAYWCLTCDKWAEKKCRDKKCEYCAGRPKRAQLLVV
jgi:hypothetical protein